MTKPDAPWWTTYDNLFADGPISDGYKDLIRSAHEANKIEWFQNSIIPGLLQTEAYARAVSGLQWPAVATQKEIDMWVAIRLKLQWETFERSQRPKMHFIIDEAALYRQVGGPAVLYEQLAHLLKLTTIENLMLQVLPIHEGGELYPYAITCFTIFSFADKHKESTLYCEYPLSFTKRAEGMSNLFLYKRTFKRLQTIADTLEQSRDHIRKAIKALDESRHRLQRNTR